ncbi:MAG: energy transducer TonB [Terriglobales bacterium]
MTLNAISSVLTIRSDYVGLVGALVLSAAVAATGQETKTAPTQSSPNGMPVYKTGPEVTPPKLIYAPDPPYSAEAQKKKLRGTVVLQAVIGTDGGPCSVSVVRSLGMGLDENAVATVSEWRFQPARKGGQPVATEVNVEVTFRWSPPFPPPPGIPIGRPGTTREWHRPEYNEACPSGSDKSGDTSQASAPSSSPPPTRVHSDTAGDLNRVTHMVKPKYPKGARREGIEGAVILHAVIANDGSVEDLQAIDGPPLLVPAALEAVRQWRYNPYFFKGYSVEVDTTITINFSLHEK